MSALNELEAAEAAAQQRLSDLQLQDLGVYRREGILTAEFKEDRVFSRQDLSQAQRRADKAGTEDAKAVKGNEGRLVQWNTAWGALQDDGTAEEEDLVQVGTGVGQSHRHRFLRDPTVHIYHEGDQRAGYRGGRGGRAGRGGGFSGQGGGTGRGGHHVSFAVDSSPPVTRRRVVKSKTEPASTALSLSGKAVLGDRNSAHPKTGRTKEKVEASKATASFDRQARQYGSIPKLTDPALFMAQMRGKESIGKPTPVHAAEPAPRVKLLAAITGLTSSLPSLRTDMKDGRLTTVTNTAASSAVTAGSAPPSTATTVSTIGGKQGIADAHSPFPTLQQTSRPAVSPVRSSLHDFLPALRDILAPDAFSKVESLACGVTRLSTAGELMEVEPTQQVAESASSQPSSVPEVKPPQEDLVKQVESLTLDKPTPSSAVAEDENDEQLRQMQDLASKEFKKDLSPPKELEDRNAPTPGMSNTLSPTEMNNSALAALDTQIQLYVTIGHDGHHKCKIPGCAKAFMSLEYWQNHVQNKHTEWLKEQKKQANDATHAIVEAGTRIQEDESQIKTGVTATELAPKAEKVRANDQEKSPETTLQATLKTAVPPSAASPTAGSRNTGILSPISVNVPAAATTDSATAGAKAPEIGSPNISQPSTLAAAPSIRDSRRSLAERLACQREAIIGEHVYRARFQPAIATLSTKTSNAASSPILATENPFGAPRASMSSANSVVSQINSRATISTFADPGAAARAQYDKYKIDMPATQPAKNFVMSVFGGDSTSSLRRSSISPHSHRSTPAKGTGPALPALLQPAAPPAQLSAPHSNASSAASRRAPPRGGGGPSLPAFLQGVTASTDTGEAVRLQYGGKAAKKADDPMEVARKRGF